MMEQQWIRHIAGELIEGVQLCVICGAVLIDYRNSSFLGSDGSIPLGWAKGAVFINGGNSMKAEPDYFIDCKPLMQTLINPDKS